MQPKLNQFALGGYIPSWWGVLRRLLFARAPLNAGYEIGTAKAEHPKEYPPRERGAAAKTRTPGIFSSRSREAALELPAKFSALVA